MEFFSPADGVIGVTIGHHSGGLPQEPRFALAAADDHPVDRRRHRATRPRLTTGGLTARVAPRRPRGASTSCRGDEVVTSSTAAQHRHRHRRATGGASSTNGSRSGVGETVYGLGERFGAFVKNGQTVDIWNADGGTASEQAYKNVPFYLSSAGYGVFVDHPEHVSFEIGSEVVSQTQFSVRGPVAHLLRHRRARRPKDVLRRYTALTGRPARVPAWSYGLWLSTSFTTVYDEATVTEFVDGMAERDLPLSVFHFDCFWMRQFHWCDFVWDPATFPDPEGMLRRLHERGLQGLRLDQPVHRAALVPVRGGPRRPATW